MAFGFFKKNEKADLIFIGGKIYTQDADLPWAEAVACKGDKILAVGDNDIVLEFEGKDTQIVDLEGKTLLPGFIALGAAPEQKALENAFIDITACEDFESVLGTLNDYIYENSDTESYFACGLNPSYLKGAEPDDIRAKLDELTSEKPLVILLANGVSAIMNTIALDTAKDLAMQEGLMYISLPFLIHALNLIDFDSVQQNVLEIAQDHCERGFTSISTDGSVDYFDSTYHDMLVEMLQNGMLKQRYYSNLYVNESVDPQTLVKRMRQKQTLCVDMEGLLDFKGLTIDLANSKFIEASEPIQTDVIASAGSNDAIAIPDDQIDHLFEMCLATADAGFDIKIEAPTKETSLDILGIFETIQSKGYRKNILTLAHDVEFDDEERANFGLGEIIAEALPKSLDRLSKAGSVSEAIDILTIDSAIALGLQDNLGTIENGKLADFAIFEQNPLDCATISEFKKLRAVMTVLNGEIVYDEQEDISSEWYELMASQQF